MTRLKILALLVGMALLFAIPATVSAQASPPHLLIINSVDGVEPADGITIVAIVNGNDVDTATTAAGAAVLTVDQGEDNFAGETISFTINGSSVPETVAWVSGTAETYELTDSGDAPVPTEDPGVVTVVKGEDGADGADGKDGTDGTDGSDGSNGAAGSDGSDGSDGADGAAGSDGSDGSNGAAGPVGPAGAAGAAGAAGKDGGGALAVVALILAIVAIVGAGGAFMMGRRS